MIERKGHCAFVSLYFERMPLSSVLSAMLLATPRLIAGNRRSPERMRIKRPRDAVAGLARKPFIAFRRGKTKLFRRRRKLILPILEVLKFNWVIDLRLSREMQMWKGIRQPQTTLSHPLPLVADPNRIRLLKTWGTLTCRS